ncbi:hypothetical protein F5Y17DRAFT_336924 [Xylariaceae sp. FL0594]|nr:hypothetical protein F5Y17DRAFT_336924 [Xylariaceae sp. FL0594]
MDVAHLTPPELIETSVPFPRLKSKPSTAGDTETLIEYDHDDRILIKVCSELHDVSVPVQYFDVNPNVTLKLLHGTDGHPVAFSLGTNGVLNCLVYLSGISEGWQLSTLTLKTPEGSAVPKFVSLDVCETAKDEACICVATKDSVHYSTLNLKRFGFDTASELPLFELSSLQWTRAPTLDFSQGGSEIVDVSCGALSQGFQILVGTEATQTAASYVLYTAKDEPTWKYVPRVETAIEVKDNLPASFNPDWNGIFTLYKAVDGSSACSATVLDPETGERSLNYRLITKGIGDASYMFAMLTPFNATDLFVAGTEGIAHFDSRRMDQLPTIMHPGKSFKQVVAAEFRQTRAHTRISVFALDEKLHLYFIEGIRRYSGNKIEWNASPYPIRANCLSISSQYNLKSGMDEILYVEQGGNRINHLMRDASGSWSQDMIRYKTPGTAPGTTTYVAASTVITLQNVDGSSTAPGGYPIWLSTSSTTYATINGVTTILGPEIDEYFTDGRGQLEIVVRAADSLRMPQYQMELGGEDIASNVYHIDPLQRAWTILKGFKTGADIRSAKSTTGELVFDQSDSKQEQYDAAAAVIKSAVESPSSVSFSWSSSDGGKTTLVTPHDNHDESLLQRVGNAVSRVFSDVLEAIERGMVTAYTAGTCVVNGVLNFFIKIGNTVWSAVLGAAERATSFVASFVKDYLGIDVEKTWKLFKYTFSHDAIVKTQQQIIVPAINDLFDKAPATLNMVATGLDEKLNQAESILDQIFDVKPQPAVKKEKGPVRKALESLLDNPVVRYILNFNPIRIITDWLLDSFNFEVSIPDFGQFAANIGDLLISMADDASTSLFELLGSLQQEAIEFILNPCPESFVSMPKHMLGRVLTEVVRLLQRVMGDVMKTATLLMEHAKELFAQEWKVPYLTDLWEAFSGQPFSLINYASYVLAALFNLVSMLVEGRLPFEESSQGSGHRILQEDPTVTEQPTAEEQEAREVQAKIKNLDLARDILRFLSSTFELFMIRGEQYKAVSRVTPAVRPQPPAQIQLPAIYPAAPRIIRQEVPAGEEDAPNLGPDIVIRDISNRPTARIRDPEGQVRDLTRQARGAARTVPDLPFSKPHGAIAIFDLISVACSAASVGVECQSLRLRTETSAGADAVTIISVSCSGTSLFLKASQMVPGLRRPYLGQAVTAIECAGNIVANTGEMVQLVKDLETSEHKGVDAQRIAIDGLSSVGSLASLISIPFIRAQRYEPAFMLRYVDAGVTIAGSVWGLVLWRFS